MRSKDTTHIADNAFEKPQAMPNPIPRPRPPFASGGIDNTDNIDNIDNTWTSSNAGVRSSTNIMFRGRTPAATSYTVDSLGL
jgi:hypothetical protein